VIEEAREDVSDARDGARGAAAAPQVVEVREEESVEALAHRPRG
jgi:hypothetical protein